MTTAEKDALNEALVKLFAAYVQETHRTYQEVIRRLSDIQEAIREAPAPPPRRRGLFR